MLFGVVDLLPSTSRSMATGDTSRMNNEQALIAPASSSFYSTVGVRPASNQNR